MAEIDDELELAKKGYLQMQEVTRTQDFLILPTSFDGASPASKRGGILDTKKNFPVS